MSNDDDAIPDPVANMDQALASAGDVARLASGLYGAFQAEGFNDAQAIYLTVCTLQQKPGAPPA